MEGKLNDELRKFWEWAGITQQEYATGKVAKKAIHSEWEEEYPNWKELERAVDEEVKIYDNSLSEERANLLLEALAIDNESELLLEKLVTKLGKEAQTHLSNIGLEYFISSARWQIAELLKRADVPNKKSLLEKMIINDESKYVQRRALICLASVDPLKAEEYAYQGIRDNDEYMRLVSLRLLKKQESEKLPQAIFLLRHDSSSLIQDELKGFHY